MGLKLLMIVALLVCETISSDYFETDDDVTPDVTEGSGDSNIPGGHPFPLPELPKARNFTPSIAVNFWSKHGFDPNIIVEKLNAELAEPGNETSIPGRAAGLIFSPSVLVPYLFIFVVSHFS